MYTCDNDILQSTKLKTCPFIRTIQTAHLRIKATGLVKSLHDDVISIKLVRLARDGGGGDCDGSHALLLARKRQS